MTYVGPVVQGGTRQQLALEVLDYLNELLALDYDFVAALCTNRVPCNRAIATHPTVQVGLVHPGGAAALKGSAVDLDLMEHPVWEAGLLGVLNGLVGIDEESGYGPIAAILDSPSGVILRFELSPAWREQRLTPGRQEA